MSRTFYSTFTKTRSRYSSNIVSRRTAEKWLAFGPNLPFKRRVFEGKLFFYFLKNYLRRAMGPLARATAVGFPYNNILQSYQLYSSVLRDLATE